MKAFPVLLTALCLGCSAPPPEHKPEFTSLLGVDYFAPEKGTELQEQQLAEARARWKQNPSEENYIWLGRRLAYVGRFREAIDVFTKGLAQYPESARLLRHRGHRYITVRAFRQALADLQMAAVLMPREPLETEPDGQPNSLNQPLSSLQFNVWYHLGLAHYLLGDFESAENAYRECLRVSVHDDLRVATADWLYMTYQRMGRPQDARQVLALTDAPQEIIENNSYYLRLQMYKGLVPPDSLLATSADGEEAALTLATQGYGVGNWFLYRGDTARAREIFSRVTNGTHRTAFGVIAAEADQMRLAAK